MSTVLSDLPFLRPNNSAGKFISIALALAMHVILAAFLFFGVRWQTKAPDAIEVELVRADTLPAAVSPAPTLQRLAPKPEPVPRPEPKAEPKPLPPPPKPDIAIKEKEKPPPKVEPTPKVDPFQEQLKRETEQLSQKKVADTAAKELTDLKAAQAASVRNKAVSEYLARIRGKIRGNIVLPPDLKGNPEAVFDVTQLPSGEIISVRLKRTSGIGALDAAIERAILKSSPLPKPEQSELFSRALELRFRPLED